jgi:hypothetical protein
VVFHAEASVELGMTLGIAGDDGGFPEIQADFFLDWGIEPVNIFNPGEFSFGTVIMDGLKEVSFRDVNLDVGSYISNVVAPLLEQIQVVT